MAQGTGTPLPASRSLTLGARSFQLTLTLPVFLFGLYTVVVWWFTFVWRRRWQGWLGLIVGFFGLLGLRALMSLIHVEGIATSPLVEILLIPYAAVLALIGAFILVMPRPHESHLCQSCGYDMAGLDARATCPECGRVDAITPGARHKAPGSPTDSSPGRPVEEPKHEHPNGQPGDQHQSQRRKP